MPEMDAFTLETAEEVFGNSVVVGVALAGHALAEAKIRERPAKGDGD